MSILNPLPSLTGGISLPKKVSVAPKPTPTADLSRVSKAALPPPSSFQSVVFKSGGSGRSSPRVSVSAGRAPSTINAAPAAIPTVSVSPSSPRDDYFSFQRGMQRVKDVFSFNFTGETLGIGTSTKPAGSFISGTLKAATGISYAGSAAYLTALALPTATASAAAGTSIFKTAKTAAVFGGLGLIGGGLLFGKGTTQTQAQDVAPNQIVQPSQTIQPNINPSQGGDVGIRQEGQGNTLNFNQQRYQNTYSTVSTTQITNPSQDVSPSQSQQSGTDWTLIALLAVGAYVLTR